MEMETTAINIITDGTHVKGDITATGDFRLDGVLEGNIQLNGKLVIGDSGVVNGNVLCQNANVIGTVNGNNFTSITSYVIIFKNIFKIIKFEPIICRLQIQVKRYIRHSFILILFYQHTI